MFQQARVGLAQYMGLDPPALASAPMVSVIHPHYFDYSPKCLTNLEDLTRGKSIVAPLPYHLLLIRMHWTLMAQTHAAFPHWLLPSRMHGTGPHSPQWRPIIAVGSPGMLHCSLESKGPCNLLAINRDFVLCCLQGQGLSPLGLRQYVATTSLTPFSSRAVNLC